MEEVEIESNGETEDVPHSEYNNKQNQKEIIKDLITKFEIFNKEFIEQKIKIEEQNKKINQLETKIKNLENENQKIKNELKIILSNDKIQKEKLDIDKKEEKTINEKNEKINEIFDFKSEIMNTEFFNQLNKWINPEKSLKFELIFKASEDGDNCQTFHKICDGKGPTVTIVKSKNGYIFGGYLTVPFSSDRKAHTDDKAFLFSLTNMKKFKILDPEHAVFHYVKGWGPYIGRKDNCDLAIKSECLSNKKSYCEPSSYEFKRIDLIGSDEKFFEVKDYEIYLVE